MHEQRARLWVSKDGTRTPVCELDLQHLKRCIWGLRKQARLVRADAIDAVEALAARDPTRWATALTQLQTFDIDTYATVLYARPHPYAGYADLLAEIQHRGLTLPG